MLFSENKHKQSDNLFLKGHELYYVELPLKNDHEKDTYTSYFSLFLVGDSPTEGQPGTRISFPQAYRLATT